MSRTRHEAELLLEGGVTLKAPPYTPTSSPSTNTALVAPHLLTEARRVIAWR